APHRPYTARSMGAITCSLRRVPSSPESLGASPKRRKRMPMVSQSPPMIPIGRPRQPAKPLLILQRNPAKRKRILYIRFLVSLGVRRRTPTRLSLSRRREIRHDQHSNGVSSNRSPLHAFHVLCRTDFR